MIKYFIRTTLAIALGMTLTISALAVEGSGETFQAVATPSKVLVDGEEVAFDAYNIADNNYFKLRDIAQVLSGTEAQFAIVWDGEFSAINMTTGQPYTTVGGELVSGDGSAKTGTASTDSVYLNGELVEMTAYNIADNNFFKLRDLGTALGFEVDFDFEESIVIVNSVVSATVETEVVEEEIVEEVVEQEVVEEAVDTVSYTYTYPTVTQPDAQGTLSVEYFSQMTLYMMVNDIASYSCKFDGISWSDLADQGIYELSSEGFFRMQDMYHELGGFYENIYQNMSTSKGDTTLTLTITDVDLVAVDGNDVISTDNSAIYAYQDTFIQDINELAATFYADGTFDPDDSDYNNALRIYRWCALNLNYDTNFQAISYTGYGALTNKTAVCQGYTAVFNALCNAFGIEAVGVSGVASGGGHIWSYVNLDGTWLYVDTTYGDPIPDTPGYCDEKYFGLTYEALSSTHTFGAYYQK